MYSKRTRFWCYAFTLLPGLVGLLLWVTGQRGFPAGILMTPVLLAMTLALCLYLTEKLEGDKRKNKKINSVVIWIIPVLSNFTFWMSYVLIYRGMELSMVRAMGWLFGALYLVLGNYLPKCRMNSVVGIRIKWTFSSEENWNATHRLAGKSYMLCGFGILLGSFLPEKWAAVVFTLLLVLGNLIPMAYSYEFYKKQQRQGVEFLPRPKWEGKVSKAAGAIGVAVLVFVAVMLFTGSVKYQFMDSVLRVDVTYYGSTDIPYGEITDVELRGENVSGSRTWGLGSYRLLAGIFENDEFGSYTRMTYYDPHSAIVLKTAKGTTYVLSGKDFPETQALYRQILEHMGQK